MDHNGNKSELCLINEASRKVNLSQKRIREYEKEGLIKPQRAPQTNNRLYSGFDLLQINRIKQLIHEAEFTVSCLKNLLALAPCWNIFGCAWKDDCAAYRNPHTPCYTTRKIQGTQCHEPCERCAVYLNRAFRKVKILEQVQAEGQTLKPGVT